MSTINKPLQKKFENLEDSFTNPLIGKSKENSSTSRDKRSLSKEHPLINFSSMNTVKWEEDKVDESAGFLMRSNNTFSDLEKKIKNYFECEEAAFEYRILNSDEMFFCTCEELSKMFSLLSKKRSLALNIKDVLVETYSGKLYVEFTCHEERRRIEKKFAKLKSYLSKVNGFSISAHLDESSKITMYMNLKAEKVLTEVVS